MISALTLTILLAVVAPLAVFRLTILVTEDKITEPLRNRILERWPAEDTAFASSHVFVNNDDTPETAYGRQLFSEGEYWYAEKAHWFGTLITCPWCASVWIATATTVALWQFPAVAFWLLLPFALSAVASVLAEHT